MPQGRAWLGLAPYMSQKHVPQQVQMLAQAPLPLVPHILVKDTTIYLVTKAQT